MAKNIPTTSIRLTAEAKRLQAALSEKLGVSLSAIIELAIRRMAKEEGIE
jgi:antitoxin component of RelBE/YafQ-DinJ toxin-antitoxin module